MAKFDRKTFIAGIGPTINSATAGLGKTGRGSTASIFSGTDSIALPTISSVDFRCFLGLADRFLFFLTNRTKALPAAAESLVTAFPAKRGTFLRYVNLQSIL